MEYTVKSLGELAGVSVRTLRYYDEIGLLKPARTNSSGYRIYGVEQVDRLQLILFYKALNFKLQDIQALLEAPDFDRFKALQDHYDALLSKRKQLDQVIHNLEQTMEAAEGRVKMNDEEKFEGLKRAMLEQNERQYGEEIREKYGTEVVEKYNAKLMNMSKEEYAEAEDLSQKILDTLSKALDTGDPESALAKQVVEMHKQWLSLYWDSYSIKAHKGVVDMYIADERFKNYYDKVKPGMAAFLRDAVYKYLD